MNKIRHIALLLFTSYFLLCLTSCSETKNLAEGETLYVGIKELAYERPPKEQKERKDSTGVITALAEAYTAVEGYLKPTPTGEDAKRKKENLSEKGPQQGYDVGRYPSTGRGKGKLEREAYATAKSEVEGVLAHSPNNSLFGSSYYRQPLAIGLWTYNRYVYSQRRFGKWMFNKSSYDEICRKWEKRNPDIANLYKNRLLKYHYGLTA